MSLTTFTLLASILTVALGLPSTSSELVRRQNATNPNGPLAGWSFVGCFTDNNPASRTLQASTSGNVGMTPKLCTSTCAASVPVTNFAGVEFATECFCDFDIQGTATKVNDTACDIACGGDSTLTCGGASLISVFQNVNSTVPLPANLPKVGNWTFDGCFTDAVGSNPRTLLESFQVEGGVTIEGCTAQCEASGFSIAGLEFGEECWCGNAFSLPAANITAPPGDCSRACTAKTTELCGAASRLSVYLLNPVQPTTSAAPKTTVVSSTTAAAPKTTVVSSTAAAPPKTTVASSVATKSA